MSNLPSNCSVSNDILNAVALILKASVAPRLEAIDQDAKSGEQDLSNNGENHQITHDGDQVEKSKLPFDTLFSKGVSNAVQRKSAMAKVEAENLSVNRENEELANDVNTNDYEQATCNGDHVVQLEIRRKRKEKKEFCAVPKQRKACSLAALVADFENALGEEYENKSTSEAEETTNTNNSVRSASVPLFSCCHCTFTNRNQYYFEFVGQFTVCKTCLLMYTEIARKLSDPNYTNQQEIECNQMQPDILMVVVDDNKNGNEEKKPSEQNVACQKEFTGISDSCYTRCSSCNCSYPLRHLKQKDGLLVCNVCILRVLERLKSEEQALDAKKVLAEAIATLQPKQNEAVYEHSFTKENNQTASGTGTDIARSLADTIIRVSGRWEDVHEQRQGIDAQQIQRELDMRTQADFSQTESRWMYESNQSPSMPYDSFVPIARYIAGTTVENSGTNQKNVESKQHMSLLQTANEMGMRMITDYYNGGDVGMNSNQTATCNENKNEAHMPLRQIAKELGVKLKTDYSNVEDGEINNNQATICNYNRDMGVYEHSSTKQNDQTENSTDIASLIAETILRVSGLENIYEQHQGIDVRRIEKQPGMLTQANYFLAGNGGMYEKKQAPVKYHVPHVSNTPAARYVAETTIDDNGTSQKNAQLEQNMPSGRIAKDTCMQMMTENCNVGDVGMDKNQATTREENQVQDRSYQTTFVCLSCQATYPSFCLNTCDESQVCPLCQANYASLSVNTLTTRHEHQRGNKLKVSEPETGKAKTAAVCDEAVAKKSYSNTDETTMIDGASFVNGLIQGGTQNASNSKGVESRMNLMPKRSDDCKASAIENDVDSFSDPGKVQPISVPKDMSQSKKSKHDRSAPENTLNEDDNSERRKRAKPRQDVLELGQLQEAGNKLTASGDTMIGTERGDEAVVLQFLYQFLNSHYKRSTASTASSSKVNKESSLPHSLHRKSKDCAKGASNDNQRQHNEGVSAVEVGGNANALIDSNILKFLYNTLGDYYDLPNVSSIPNASNKNENYCKEQRRTVGELTGQKRTGASTALNNTERHGDVVVLRFFHDFLNRYYTLGGKNELLANLKERASAKSDNPWRFCRQKREMHQSPVEGNSSSKTKSPIHDNCNCVRNSTFCRCNGSSSSIESGDSRSSCNGSSIESDDSRSSCSTYKKGIRRNIQSSLNPNEVAARKEEESDVSGREVTQHEGQSLELPLVANTNTNEVSGKLTGNSRWI